MLLYDIPLDQFFIRRKVFLDTIMLLSRKIFTDSDALWWRKDVLINSLHDNEEILYLYYFAITLRTLYMHSNSLYLWSIWVVPLIITLIQK